MLETIIFVFPYYTRYLMDKNNVRSKQNIMVKE